MGTLRWPDRLAARTAQAARSAQVTPTWPHCSRATPIEWRSCRSPRRSSGRA